jgi:hypothetical protein
VPFVTPATAALVHPNVAPAVVLAGVYVNGVFVQTEIAVSGLVKTGTGFTETTTDSVFGGHPFAVVVYE